jgi:hypothetical protein
MVLSTVELICGETFSAFWNKMFYNCKVLLLLKIII